MGLDFITRRRATVAITVDRKPRRFTLRAHSISEHLQMLELQEAAHKDALAPAENGSSAQVARAGLTALLSVVLPLLQEPADGGPPLVEEDGWLLGLGDPDRVLRLQHELTALEAALGAAQPAKGKIPSAEEVAFEWLDIGTTIARAGLAPNPHVPLNEWSIAQCVETYHRACRELWRDVNLRVQLAGGKGEQERSFESQRERTARVSKRGSANSQNIDSAPFTPDDEVAYAAMKAKYEAVSRDPDGRKFPGTL